MNILFIRSFRKGMPVQQRPAIAIAAFISGIVYLSSCYHSELVYSFEKSYGGAKDGSSCYYLGQVREYRNPKGISRFPDGGMSKEIRQAFGFFRSDTAEKATELLSPMGKIYRWPSGFETRIEKRGENIVFGIRNISFPDSLNGIYIYNTRNRQLIKWNVEGTMPAFSDDGKTIAFLSGGKLKAAELQTGNLVYEIPVDSTSVYIKWAGDKTILLFCFSPARVFRIDLQSGQAVPANIKYIPGYSQDLTRGDIERMAKQTRPDLKKILDNTQK